MDASRTGVLAFGAGGRAALRAFLAASAQDGGVPRREAIVPIGAVGLASLPGRVLTGLLADRPGRRAVFLSCCGGVAAATLAWAGATERAPFGLFAVAFGVLYGGSVALLPAFTTTFSAGARRRASSACWRRHRPSPPPRPLSEGVRRHSRPPRRSAP